MECRTAQRACSCEFGVRKLASAFSVASRLTPEVLEIIKNVHLVNRLSENLLFQLLITLLYKPFETAVLILYGIINKSMFYRIHVYIM